MGLADTVQNEGTGEVYTVSTIPRYKKLSLPELGKVYVICETAVYLGQVNPLRAATHKPLFAAYHYLAFHQYTIEQVHDIFTSACSQLEFDTAEDLLEPFKEHDLYVDYVQSRQLLVGARKVDLLYIG